MRSNRFLQTLNLHTGLLAILWKPPSFTEMAGCLSGVCVFQHVCRWCVRHRQLLKHARVHTVRVFCLSWLDFVERWDSPLDPCCSILDRRRWLSRLESFRAPGTSDSPHRLSADLNASALFMCISLYCCARFSVKVSAAPFTEAAPWH